MQREGEWLRKGAEVRREQRKSWGGFDADKKPK